MFNRIVRYFLENRLVTFIFLIAFVVMGLITMPFSLKPGLLPRDPVPVDAIPDIGENQQIVATEWMGRSPKDIQDQITYPLTTALLGIPGVQTIRSTSMFGMSFIYIIFKDNIEFYLAVNFTCESNVTGQTLGQIYSPELITAQQELLEAAKTKLSQPAIYEAAREKLRQMKLTEKQISETEDSGETRSTVDIISNTSGIVLSRRVNTGDYVTQGMVLFDVSDLSKVWVMFDAYENDLQFLINGELISFSINAIPGHQYAGKIIFIDPVIDPVTRVAKVRVEADNHDGKLKPGMFATGFVSSVPGGYSNKLVIPRSAVLWTAKRSVVYVKQSGTDEPVFKMREIELGHMLGDSYLVTDGLNEGE